MKHADLCPADIWDIIVRTPANRRAGVVFIDRINESIPRRTSAE